MKTDHLLLLFFFISLTTIAFVGGTLTRHYAEDSVSNIIEASEHIRSLNTPPVPIKNANYDIDKNIRQTSAYWNKEKALNGATLITLRYSQDVYLLDMNGDMLWKWNAAFKKAWPKKPPHIKKPVATKRIYIEKAVMYPNGDILVTYTGIGSTPYGYGMAKFDKHSNVLWTLDERVHHDIYIDKKSGDIYTLTHKFLRHAEGLEGLHYPLLADTIIKLSNDGKIVDSISILEAYRGSTFSPLLYQQPKNQLRWDRLHTNAVLKLEPYLADKFPLFKAGDLLISSRNTNTIAVIDPITKKVKWAYNGLWKGQHSPRFTSRGTILVYDNKGHIYKGKPYSRIIEINPNNLKIEWSYIGSPQNSFYSDVYGRVQELANGNILVTEALSNRVFEINRNKEIVWEYKLPLSHPFQQRIKVNKKKSPRIVCFDICAEEYSNVSFAYQGLIIDATRYSPEEINFLPDSSLQ